LGEHRVSGWDTSGGPDATAKIAPRIRRYSKASDSPQDGESLAPRAGGSLGPETDAFAVARLTGPAWSGMVRAVGPRGVESSSGPCRSKPTGRFGSGNTWLAQAGLEVPPELRIMLKESVDQVVLLLQGCQLKAPR
jgi:hypothetical protein